MSPEPLRQVQVQFGRRYGHGGVGLQRKRTAGGVVNPNDEIVDLAEGLKTDDHRIDTSQLDES